MAITETPGEGGGGVEVGKLYTTQGPGGCEDPGIPPHTLREGNNFSIYSSVIYTCDDQHEYVSGSTYRECSENGTWSGDVYTCEIRDLRLREIIGATCGLIFLFFIVLFPIDFYRFRRKRIRGRKYQIRQQKAQGKVRPIPFFIKGVDYVVPIYSPSSLSVITYNKNVKASASAGPDVPLQPSPVPLSNGIAAPRDRLPPIGIEPQNGGVELHRLQPLRTVSPPDDHYMNNDHKRLKYQPETSMDDEYYNVCTDVSPPKTRKKTKKKRVSPIGEDFSTNDKVQPKAKKTTKKKKVPTATLR